MNTGHASRVLSFPDMKRVVPITAVLERYGVLGDLKRIGAQLFGVCPIHQGTHKKQFVVEPNKGLWRCFGDCNRGGDTISLVAELEHVEISEAARLIAGWFAIGTSNHSSNHRNQQRRKSMSGEKPTHTVHSAQKREGEKDFLTRIGSGWAFDTKDGRTGLNIQLSALPVGDRMVIFEAGPEKEEDGAADKQTHARKK